ncbi:MAG TPA: pyrroloquinoline quinone biosynthesis protein PqqE [Nitrospira sp.]|nr:pyrroloquinoline quinone biosynthesis protein PqqE [Nitrospira sp.]
MGDRPYTLTAELTYRCPLHCAYCSNPISYEDRPALDTEQWCRLFAEAEAIGIMQVNFTGGEPLLRSDLEILIAHAHRLGLYTNLITSGVPLTRRRFARLRASGLDAVQLSLQSTEQVLADQIAGLVVHKKKLAVARWTHALRMPLTLNIVLHRQNIEQIGEIIALAEGVHADRLELANTQYLGWALMNRHALLPTQEQLEQARLIAHAARERLLGRMEIIFVTPDYYTGVPRACMDGWGRRHLVVSPDGLVLPCHLAHTLPGLTFERAGTRPLLDIWEQSEGFNRFRGEAWMVDTCRNCVYRGVDFGGCRCQAFHLTGQLEAMDPVCRWSPDHHLIETARGLAERNPAPAPVSAPLRKRELHMVP